jgi:hypothetical protein
LTVALTPASWYPKPVLRRVSRHLGADPVGKPR